MFSFKTDLHLFSYITSCSYISLGLLGCCRGKRVIELGSGYGLAGLVIAAATEASEVVISDGNPQVVNCILLVLLCVYCFIRVVFFLKPRDMELNFFLDSLMYLTSRY